VPAATIAILQATRLPLQLRSGRFKNKESGASRTCYFAGRPPGSVSQADRAFQNRQGSAATFTWHFTAFSERPDSLDGCIVELDRR